MYSLYYVYVSKNRSLRCSNHFVGFLNLAMHSKGIWLFSVILVECSNHSIALSILIIIISIVVKPGVARNSSPHQFDTREKIEYSNKIVIKMLCKETS